MGDWNSINEEINKIYKSRKIPPGDIVRQKYIEKLSKISNRNIIFYYSAFLTCTDNPAIAINDVDMNGFMSVIHNMDKEKGLDLVIHTPGGEVAAAENIGNYLRSVFKNNIRVFIPQMAMSAGTMLSFIGKEIYMGRHSSIGPIDPQILGIPAWEVIQDFESAMKETSEDPSSIPIWQTRISQYPPALVGQCYKAIQLSSEVSRRWLNEGLMFDGDKNKMSNIDKIMKYLNDNKKTKIHSRHIEPKKAKDLGLNVKMLEEHDELQDAVLSVHHCYMYAFQASNVVKIIENNNNKAFMLNSIS